MLTEHRQLESTVYPATQVSSYNTCDNRTFSLLRDTSNKYFIRESVKGQTVALILQGSENFKCELEHFEIDF